MAVWSGLEEMEKEKGSEYLKTKLIQVQQSVLCVLFGANVFTYQNKYRHIDIYY